MPFSVESDSAPLRSSTMPSTTSSLSTRCAVGAVNGLADLAQPDLRPLRRPSRCRSTRSGVPFLVLRTVCSMSCDVGDEADRAHVDLLQAGLDEAAAGVHVVVGELLLDLADAQAVGDQLVRIDAHLVFAGDAAEAGHVDDVGHRLELLLEHPVLERLQLHHVVRRIGAVQRVPVDLTDRAPVGAHLRLQVLRAGSPATAAPGPSAGSSRSPTRRRRSASRSRARTATSSADAPGAEGRSSRFRAGMVTCCSTSSAARPGHCVMTWT